MRDLLMIKSDKFDLSEKKEEIQNLVQKFSDYLDKYPTGSKPSKHEIMGSVAGILEMAKNNKRYTADFIKSRALRKHEMNKISGYLSDETFKKLEEAVDSLISLRSNIPEMQIKKAMELIDGELYFLRRKKNVEFFDKTKLAFSEFMKQKYLNNLNELNEKWNESFKSWNDLPYPKKDFENDKNNTKKDDVIQFKNNQKGEK